MTPIDRALRHVHTALVAVWAMTIVHHAYEAGRYDRPARLNGVMTATVGLLLTAVLLYRYERTHRRWAFVAAGAMILVFWTVVVGGFLSGYSYALRLVLYYGGVSEHRLSRIWPGEQVPPNDGFHETTGVLTFLAAIWLVVAWARLWRREHTDGAADRLDV